MVRLVSTAALVAAVALLGLVAQALAAAPVQPVPANTNEIITSYGYPCEQHWAPTTDGWILSLQRIPYGLKNKVQPRRGVVMFQHGLTDSSAGVTLNGPEESLAFILADAGFDVWLGNNRGNGYSMNNTRYNSSQPQFWEFSWDDMAIYDLPANIDYILGVTGAKQLSYIGHSEGTIQAFAGFLNPTVAAKVNIFVALAPVAWVGNVEVKLLQVMADLDTDLLFEILGLHEFYIPHAADNLVPGLCDWEPKLCSFAMQLVSGPSPHLNSSRTDYYLNYEPNPTSVKNMAHWAQNIRTKTFRKFDYGAKGNQQHYGQPTPPEYDVSKWPASLPIALFCGSLDYLADPSDVQILLKKLPMQPTYVHYETTYGHLDPLLAPDAAVKIYPLILDLLNKVN